jgi:hypothetical protein
MHLNALSALLALLALLPPTLAIDHDANPPLNQQLSQAPTWLDRWNILANTPNNSWKYDFATSSQYPYRSAPGAVCNANLAAWPALTGIGATVGQLNLGPRSMLPPHFHREHHVVVAITGNTTTMMVQENGAGVTRETLSPGQATVFPRASMHTMINDGEFSSGVSSLREFVLMMIYLGCSQNLLYSFLSGGDPGTVNVMNNVMMFGQDVGEVVLPWRPTRIALLAGIGTLRAIWCPRLGVGVTRGRRSVWLGVGLVARGRVGGLWFIERWNLNVTGIVNWVSYGPRIGKGGSRFGWIHH